MTELPDKIWTTGNKHSGSWNDKQMTLRNPPPETEYTRTEVSDTRIAELEAALFAVRNEICIGPTLDTLWHSSVPAETTVDYICNILQDDWDYDEWLTTHETLKETT
jgi:hypothetical protein